MSVEDPHWPRASSWLATPSPDTDDVDLAVLGVPAFRTSLSATRADLTPPAVRTVLARYGTAAADGVDLSTLRVHDAGDVADPDSDETATAASVQGLAASSGLVVALGGDNSITVAVAQGALGPDLARAGLVTLDAHHDVRRGRSNGSPVRRLIEAGLPPSRIVQVGIADFANSPDYAAEVREWGIRVINRADVALRGIGDCMTEAFEIAGAAGGGIHVDLDVDVCDRSVAPGCPASLPGGLSAAELLQAARMAGAHRHVRSIDIVEVDASRDSADERTVRLAALLLLHAAGGLTHRAPG